MYAESYEQVFSYLKESKYPDGASKNLKRRIREKSLSFFVSEDALYHRGRKGKQQRVLRKEEVPAVLQEMRIPVVGGAHLGMNATQQKTAERFWWANMTEDVRHCVKTCERYAIMFVLSIY